jgi:hypothetical protein
LCTRRFEVRLDSIDRVARLDYDLAAGDFRLTAARPVGAVLRVRLPAGRWREGRIGSS